MKFNANQIINNLKETMNMEGIPFMEGKTPSELVEGEVVTLCDYGFIDGKDGKYVVFMVKEDKEHFYFGGLVLTQLCETLDTYSDEEIEAVLVEGIKFSTTKKKSKNGRTYTKVTLL